MNAAVFHGQIDGTGASSDRWSARGRAQRFTFSHWLSGLAPAALGRLFVIVLVAMTLAGGAAVCRGEHLSALGDGAASAQSSGHVVKALTDHVNPSKNTAPAPCSGHCAAHALGIPVSVTQIVAVSFTQAVWLVMNDQWSQASRPTRLERPPRI